MNSNEIASLLLMAFANSFVIIGWNRATYFEWAEGSFTEINHETKMIFWKLRYWGQYYFYPFWNKPLFTCPTCMSSFHSIYVYWLIQPPTIHSLIIYPIYILLLAGMVTLINSFA